VSIAYSLTALLALAVIRQRVGGLGGDELTTPVKRVVGASAVMGVATVIALSVSGADAGFGLLVRVAFAVVVGSGSYVATAAILGAREAHRAVDARSTGSALGAGPAGPPPEPAPSLGGRPPAAEPPIHDRLDERPEYPSVRLLRPVVDPPGDPESPEGEPGRAEGEDDGVEVEDQHEGEDEEHDGQDPGGNR
jgi:hypothetical protein